MADSDISDISKIKGNNTIIERKFYYDKESSSSWNGARWRNCRPLSR